MMPERRFTYGTQLYDAIEVFNDYLGKCILYAIKHFIGWVSLMLPCLDIIFYCLHHKTFRFCDFADFSVQ